MLKKLLHEPLIHFLFIGGFIFFIYNISNKSTEDTSAKIIISKAQVQQLKLRWEKKYFREPTKEELNKLIDQKIYEQVMVKEAISLGLDKDDHIINRRLMQKVEFISSDLANVVQPSEKELQKYLNDNHQKFVNDTRISFKQLYFTSLKEAEQTLVLLTKNQLNEEAIKNTFMLSKNQENLSKQEVTRRFGKIFSNSLFGLEKLKWSKPLKSGYGYHLVFVKEVKNAPIPSLDTVYARVKDDYLNTQQEKINRKFYESLLKNYAVEIQK